MRDFLVWCARKYFIKMSLRLIFPASFLGYLRRLSCTEATHQSNVIIAVQRISLLIYCLFVVFFFFFLFVCLFFFFFFFCFFFMFYGCIVHYILLLRR